MPHETIWDEHGIRWKYHGIVPLAEVYIANTEFYSDHRSDTSKYQIFDATEAEEFVGTEEEVKKIAAIDLGASFSNRNLKVAIVVQDSMRPIADQYVASSVEFKSPWDFGVFSNIDEAEAWVRG